MGVSLGSVLFRFGVLLYPVAQVSCVCFFGGGFGASAPWTVVEDIEAATRSRNDRIHDA